jgi:NADPH-dependent curcumin reductase CurA
MRGYLYFDYVKQFPAAIAELQNQVNSGKLITRIDMQYGLEECPRALRKLLMGENQGKVIVKVDNVREKLVNNVNAKL